MLPLPTTEEKTTLLRTDAVPRTTEDHRLFKKIWIHASRYSIINKYGEEEVRKYRMDRGH